MGFSAVWRLDLVILPTGLEDLILPCPEYVRLRQRYESALRHWGEVLLPQDSELVGAWARQRAQLTQDVLEERDAANERMRVHERSCPACREQS